MYLLVFSLTTLHLPAGWVVVTCRLGGADSAAVGLCITVMSELQ